MKMPTLDQAENINFISNPISVVTKKVDGTVDQHVLAVASK